MSVAAARAPRVAGFSAPASAITETAESREKEQLAAFTRVAFPFKTRKAHDPGMRLKGADIKFVKVEDFFTSYHHDDKWSLLDTVEDVSVSGYVATIRFKNGMLLQLQFPAHDVVRILFHPEASEYLDLNPPSIVENTMEELTNSLKTVVENGRLLGKVRLIKTYPSESKCTISQKIVTGDDERQSARDGPLELNISFSPFGLELRDTKNGTKIWKTAPKAIQYLPNGSGGEYKIVLAVEKPGQSRYVGFGEQGGQNLVKNMAQMTYFNFDNMMYNQVYGSGPLDPKEPMYHSDPFFIEFQGAEDKKCIGSFVANLGQICVDIGCTHAHRILIGTSFNTFDYMILINDDCPGVLRRYTQFIGRSRLKPRYVLGYHQGSYGYERDQDLKDVVKNYRDTGIPLDGLHVDVDLQINHRTFTHDTQKFGKNIFAELKKQGIKCSTNITPIISDRGNYPTYSSGCQKGFFIRERRCDDPEKQWDGRYQDFEGGNEIYKSAQNPPGTEFFTGKVYYGGNRETTGVYPDFGNPDVRLWWGEQYKELLDSGVEMIWQDMTTPAIQANHGDMRGFPFRLLVTDNSYRKPQRELVMSPSITVWNLYSYNLYKATYHGLNFSESRKGLRNFIIGRGSFTGSHRFAGLWNGDNASTWDFLRINVAQCLALGLTGVVISGQDIGGFAGGGQSWEKWVSPELLIRWTAAGAFLPWFRNHYIRKDGVKYFQEPYAYANLDQTHPYNSDVLPVCRYYIVLRYRLLQLFYDAMFDNQFTGLPICRTLLLSDPKDGALFNDKAFHLSDQFTVGNDFLVAPILSPETTNRWGEKVGMRDIYLPSSSDWFLFQNNQYPLKSAHEGGRTIRNFDATINSDPNHLNFIVPMFVRAGAIIPTLEPEMFVGEREYNPITFSVYPGANGQYANYLDDGVSRNSAPKSELQYQDDTEALSMYRKTMITHLYTPVERTVTFEREWDQYSPKLPEGVSEYFYVALLYSPADKDPKDVSISINDVGIDKKGGDKPWDLLDQANTNAFYHNEYLRTIFIKIFMGYAKSLKISAK
eukprot:TRINITY_DN10248_c0_g1_i1.p1 TRINITY_DN10248_c0_g1~~TRINITY_DN10248_c0_g1_i1.p1  ORF type:complete len:1044 (+),score=132.55 TRINITY_DN10248_c0_g1_i1:157-3288(+)